MAKRTRKTNENILEPAMQKAIFDLFNEVTSLADHYSQYSFCQSGATSIESARHTNEIFGPSMPTAIKYLTQHALEQTGLKIYSTFVPRNDKDRARQFKETILTSPFDYRATSLATDTNQVDLFEISVGSGSRLPAHQRIRHSYLNILNRTPDEDGLIRESALGINRFGAKAIAPEIFLTNSYMTEDQYQYIQMIDTQVLESAITAHETASMPLSEKLNSSNAFVRAQGSLVQDARRNFTESQNLGLLTPNSMDIDELRTYISSLF